MTAEEPEQDLSGYLNAAADSMNYADDRGKPFKADEGPEVELEEIAYEQQAAVRESAGADPETGVPLEDMDEEDRPAPREEEETEPPTEEGAPVEEAPYEGEPPPPEDPNPPSPQE